MRAVVIGLGSMGRRRVRNLRAVGLREIIGVDPRVDRREQARQLYGIDVVATRDEGLARSPDLVIVAAPPDQHTDAALDALAAGAHCFTEINCPRTIDESDRLIAAAAAAGTLAVPSCTLRFHPALQTIKRLVDEQAIGTVLTSSYHSGNYLPSWHPWEHIRDYYVASRETGGGRDQMVFELEPICWIMGAVRSVSAMAAHRSTLETTAFDVYHLLMEHVAGAIGHLQMDLLAQPAERSFRIIGSDGSLHWNWSDHRVRWYRPDSQSWREYGDGPGLAGWHTEQMYLDELTHALAAMRGEVAYASSFAVERHLLAVLFGAEASAASGQRVVL
jgi:predicted dehydrogenase